MNLLTTIDDVEVLLSGEDPGTGFDADEILHHYEIKNEGGGGSSGGYC